MYVNEDECEAAGLDPEEVKRIATGLSRYAKKAEALGLQIFGGTGTGSLRFDDGGPGKLVVAEIEGNFDGGDGGSTASKGGLLRGEC
ncbi:hypothetical protein DET61_11679 [Marinobacter nauticus]|jgi:hypothetical protein|uniref:Uncharacterized protein n=1 Tax=Marinobacter nauticus TaxID=2743 RepID=A0A368XAK5_MARNT|nr:hypothetical protein [Marinobacter nauticus]RCW64038.1 hypothetical protein DET61_11679 [Marinobacter nauticus]|tara:strand:- start:3227 stop:3487 length:261 start_codon:yes stop_codon:yes gene_type:complete